MERKGKTSCTKGNTIKDRATCKKACDYLKLSKQSIVGGNVCYKDSRGNCYQDGWNGAGASIICKNWSFIAHKWTKNGNMIRHHYANSIFVENL